MGTNIRVTKTIYDDGWLLFEEADVRKACELEGCSPEMIEGCIESMKAGDDDCSSCYVTLVNEIKAVPEYQDA